MIKRNPWGISTVETNDETPEFQFQLQFPLRLQFEYPSSTWVHIKIIRASLAFLSHNGRCEHRPVAKGVAGRVRCGVALWPAPAAGCWHRFGLNISHYFSFNDGMQWKRNSEFWNVCLHASPGQAGSGREGGCAAFFSRFFSHFLLFA